MEYTLSTHAERVMQEREIRPEWVAATLADPGVTEPDVNDPSLRHALRSIEEFGYRVLRVVYNDTRQPVHVVTVYFDRAMKGKL